MKTYLGVILVIGLLLLALPLAAQEFLTPNEELVMSWLDASLKPEKVETAVKDMLAPDFVFYDLFNSPAVDAAAFSNLDVGRNLLPGYVVSCVVKSEDDLVEASYSMVNSYGMQLPLRTVLFRIENNQIAEAWLDHTL